MDKSYSISELAKEFDVTPRAIRFYEDKGLISPSRNGQHRIYSPKDRIRLMLVLRGKRLGLSLDQSREIIELYSPNSNNTRQLQTMYERLQEQEENLKQKMKDLKAMQKEIKEAKERCLKALNDVRKNNKSVE